MERKNIGETKRYMEDLISKLTVKDNKYACALADKIISESKESDKWYEYFDDFATLLNHPNSLVRNRAIYILAANAQWDYDNKFDLILPDFLSHITDEKPITARQCIKALAQVGTAKPQYVPKILSCLEAADLFKYNDTMRPLIEKDIEETKQILTNKSRNEAHPMNFRWYAAYHNKEKNPHVHMLVWSDRPTEPYLSPTGIHNIKQKIAGDIFRYEMMSIYKKQTEVRDGLKDEFRQRLRELADKLQKDPGEISPELYQKISLLYPKLLENKGKKTYHRHHATAGGGQDRPRNRRYRRTNARTCRAQGKEQPTAKAPTEPTFEPYKGKIRKPGTGCVTMINDHLYGGRFTPTNADGKRISRNIYAQTREECEEKLAMLIVEMKAEIKAEKERRKKE